MKNNKHTYNPAPYTYFPFRVFCAFRLTLLSILLVLSISASAQTQLPAQSLQARLDNINRQITALHSANARSPQAESIRSEIKTAAEDYEKDVKAIPGIKEIDTEIEKLRQQMMQLHQRKMKLIEANEKSLEKIKSRIDNASESLRQTISGGDQGSNLRTEQQRLIEQIEENNKPATTNNH